MLAKSLKAEYSNWIGKHYPTDRKAYGQCDSATRRMVDAFPELRRVRGYYTCSQWGERAHWWCLDPDGNIVDPTAVQFPSRGDGDYRELAPGELVPTNRCANCGGNVYNGDTVCSPACHAAYATYLNNPRG